MPQFAHLETLLDGFVRLTNGPHSGQTWQRTSTGRAPARTSCKPTVECREPTLGRTSGLKIRPAHLSGDSLLGRRGPEPRPCLGEAQGPASAPELIAKDPARQLLGPGSRFVRTSQRQWF